LFECYKLSKDLVKKYKNVIQSLSKVLLDKEFLTKEEFEEMIERMVGKKK
jgi:ATP-dependent Zn protease